MALELRYQEIQKRFEELSGFSVESVTSSRNLFHLEADRVVPRKFEVWTSLVGLPLPNHLAQNFQALFHRITEGLSANRRFYQVIPQNYHWELLIIKRPDEEVDEEHLHKAPEMFYGELEVSETKYVRERQWYMESDLSRRSPSALARASQLTLRHS